MAGVDVEASKTKAVSLSRTMLPLPIDPSSTLKPSPTSATGHSTPPSNQSPDLHLGMFEIGKALGKGTFGRVYLARHRPSGFICALKVLNKEEIREENAEVHVRREIEVHSKLRHPGNLGFYNWFHDSSRIFLVLEYAPGGEVYKSLQREFRFTEQRAAKYAAQVAHALIYLHSKNIMHRDIKPENILVGLHGELKLADFGYSVHAPGNFRSTLCGTLDYIPPEMLNFNMEKYTKAVDQWALGALTYEFLTGKAPFVDDYHTTRKRIFKCDMWPFPTSVSSEARDFVKSLLVLDPTKRLPLTDAIRHPWIVMNCASR
ncbi:kinase-like protein [Hypomontagnella monticulosa]|nr:kinase-like protein [Hypomontagnella monticulosa]